MEQFNKLILVSKESILNKRFGIDMDAYSKLSEKEKENVKNLFPTEEEENFMYVFRSTIPQLARLQRKMSVCLDVEVLEYDFDFVIFTYSGKNYKIIAAKNAYRICKALEKGVLEALAELGTQGCIFIDNKQITSITQDGILEVDEIELLKKVADKFFFQTFLV